MSLETIQPPDTSPTSPGSWLDIQVGTVRLKMSISQTSPLLRPREVAESTRREIVDYLVKNSRERESFYRAVPGIRTPLRLRLPELDNPSRYFLKGMLAYQTLSKKIAQVTSAPNQDNSLWLITELCKAASEVIGPESLTGHFLNLVSRLPAWPLIVGAAVLSELIEKLGVQSEVSLERPLTPEELAKVTELAGAGSINLECLGGQIIAALIASAEPDVYEDIKRLVTCASEELALELELSAALGEANPDETRISEGLSYEDVIKIHDLWAQNSPALPETRRVSLQEPTQEELAAFWTQGEVVGLERVTDLDAEVRPEVRVTYYALEGCAGCDAFDPAWELLSNAYANFTFTRVLMRHDDPDLFAEIRNYPTVVVSGPFGATTIEGLACLQTTLPAALEGISRVLKNAPLNLVPPSN